MLAAQRLARQVVELVDKAVTTADDKERWRLWQDALLKTLELDGICSEHTSATFGAWLARVKESRDG